MAGLWIFCQSVTAADPGILLTDDQGKLIYAENKDRPYTPASILKLLTSLAVLKSFGTVHQFETWYAYDTTSKILYIKGFGDPLFISEEIQSLVDQIIETTCLTQVQHIILDHSFFDPNIVIPGTGNSLNPYDATTGALCANFNTIFFKWEKKSNRHISAESQTPLLDIFQADIKSSRQTQGRILLSKEQRDIYPGLLIKYFLEKEGVLVAGSVTKGKFNGALKTKSIFLSSFTMDQVVQKLLKYSNNFMANQLMLTLGAYKFGPPATLEKGIQALKDFAEDQLGLSQISIAEGSGLSRKNSLTPQQMHTILMAFIPFHHLMSVEGNEYYKTGTLSDVRTRTGFFRGKDNRLYPFIIMLNNTRTGYKDIQEKLRKKVAVLSGGG